MKPVIGVMPLWDELRDSLWMLPGYLDGISQAGGLPLIFPFTSDEEEISQLMDRCDGFLLTGGHDVSPDIYGEDPLPQLQECCRKRDDMELIVLRKAVEQDKSVLGICRGLQFINAALGGTLYQDLPTQRPSGVEHHQSGAYDAPTHDVDLVADSPLCRYLGKTSMKVNSYHHQGVKDLADSLSVMGTAPDGLTEALYRPSSRFLWAVQWHPEFMFRTDADSREIFRAFVESMS